MGRVCSGSFNELCLLTVSGAQGLAEMIGGKGRGESSRSAFYEFPFKFNYVGFALMMISIMSKWREASGRTQVA